jgi:hypothetical protein
MADDRDMLVPQLIVFRSDDAAKVAATSRVEKKLASTVADSTRWTLSVVARLSVSCPKSVIDAKE